MAGVVPLLVGLLESPHTDTRKEAMLGLLALSDQDRARDTLRQQGAVLLLVDMLQAEAAEYSEYSAKVLHALAMHEDSREAIAEAGALEALVKMLDVQDGVSASNEAAALALQTLAYDNPDNSRQLAESGAHGKLLELLGSAVLDNNINTQAAAGTALLNLAQVNEEVRSDLVGAQGGLDLLVEVLNMSCSDHLFADEALSSEAAASQEAAASLIGMLAEDDDDCADAIGKTPAIPRCVELLSSNNIGSKRASAWALRHLASTDDNRVAMTEAGAIVPLVQLLCENYSGDEQGDEAQTAAAGALQILAMNDACSEAIAQAGGIPGLVHCLHDGSDFLKVVAAGALGTLAYNHNNCVEIVQTGGIPALVELLRNDNGVEGQESAAVALYSLAGNEDNRVMIMEAGAIPPLVRMIQSDSPEAQEAAAQALGGLAKTQACRESIAQMEAIPSLVELLGAPEHSMFEEAARALHNLALEPGSQAQAVLLAGAVEALLALLDEDVEDGDYDAVRAACQALSVMAPYSGTAGAVLRSASGLQGLLRLLKPPAPAVVQMLAAQTLAGCAATAPEAALQMTGQSTISSLLAMTAAPSDSSQLWATKALLCIARVPEGCAALRSVEAAPVLLAILQEPASRSDTLLEAVLNIVLMLCQSGRAEQRAEIFGARGMLDIAGLLTSGSGAASCEVAAKVLSNVVVDSTEAEGGPEVLAALVGWLRTDGAERFQAGAQEAAQVVCRLSRQPGDAPRVLEAGGAAALIAILHEGIKAEPTAERDLLQVEAADSVAVLAATEQGRSAIISCGGAEVLVAMLSSEAAKGDQRRQARLSTLEALDALAVDNAACGEVVVAGAMEPLRRLFGEGNEREKELATSILNHLQGQGRGGGGAGTADTGGSEDLSGSEDDDEGGSRLLDSSVPGVVEEPQEDGHMP
mmetsp:Transcript_5721/g.16057  ORF Transcript_5721/g.16057 Transcript_5721/m.16057 type:complete len:924 (+) Transcript_5721:137-2908(+)